MKKPIIDLLLIFSTLFILSCNNTPSASTPEATPCTDHTFGEWETVKEPTCLEGGTESRICQNCGFSEERATEAVDHLYSEWEVVEKATIYVRGKERCACIYCNEEKTRNTDRVEKLSSKPVFNFQNKYDNASPRIYRTQGGCFDGTNFYQALISKNEEIAVILKKNIETGETIYSEPRPMKHANDVTYNSTTNMIYVCEAGVNVYIYNADTLEFVKSVTLPYGISAISYNEHDNTFVGLAGTKNYYYSSSFNYIRDMTLQERGATSQGMCSDEKYVYNLYCKSLGGGSYDTYIIIHTHKGVYINTVEVSIANKREPENISIIDGVMYIECPTGTPSGTIFQVLMPD